MSDLRLYRFDRIRRGQKMAEGIAVRAVSLKEATQKANKLREHDEANEEHRLDWAIPCVKGESNLDAMRRAVFWENYRPLIESEGLPDGWWLCDCPPRKSRRPANWCQRNKIRCKCGADRPTPDQTSEEAVERCGGCGAETRPSGCPYGCAESVPEEPGEGAERESAFTCGECGTANSRGEDCLGCGATRPPEQGET